jgi:hypothetical protein
MDWDECVEIERKVKHTTWLATYMLKREGELTTWVSTFHPDKLQCSLVHNRVQDDARGSFNVGCTVRFTNDEIWMVRFPRGGKVILADEKVVAEVATINVIRNQTSIPVPEIKAWGRAADNALGIGPFIMTVFVEGVSLGQLLQDSTDSLMRHDVSDETIKTLFRQVARIVLQLSKLDFARIGSMSTESPVPNDNYAASIQCRPLTLKAHDILQVGGINTLCTYCRSNVCSLRL